MKFFSFLFGKQKLTLEEGDKMHDELYSNISKPLSTESELTKSAIKLLTSGKHTASIEVYKQLINEYPAQRDTYESQIGANYYFLGEFENAIEYYTLSMQHGFNKSMSDDNIWEAYLALYEKTKHQDYIQQYMEQFPQGNFIKKANSLLSK